MFVLMKNLLPLLILNYFSESQSGPIVYTISGKIEGHYRFSRKVIRYEAYEGIPYALPPTGERRFEPPSPKERWEGVLMANKFRKPCLGYKSHPINNSDVFTGVEDCLYLNVYVPEKKSNASLPVIIQIYGGGFMFSDMTDEDQNYLIDHDLVYVTFNYRHNMFGFLSTEDDLIPGNMALKDQALAIRWVSENIKYFGGDPKRVTLIGLSSGASSVHYHYLSPMSRGLFHSGISFSGNAFNCRALPRSVKNNTILIGKIVNCPTENMSQLVQCLKSKPADELLRALASITAWKLPGTYFGPVVEKHSKNPFIDRSPAEIIASGDAYDVPWINGNVRDEGLFPVAEFALNKTAMKIVDENWEAIAPVMLSYENTIPKSQQANVSRIIREHYMGDKSINRKNLQPFVDMVSDRTFKFNGVESAKAMAKANRGPVWYYHYTYKAAKSFCNVISKSNESLGVCHGDDYDLIIANGFVCPAEVKSDMKMHEKLIKLVTTVARTGVPTEFYPKWKKLNTCDEKIRYLEISDAKKFEIKAMSSNFAQAKFWKSIPFNENVVNTR